MLASYFSWYALRLARQPEMLSQADMVRVQFIFLMALTVPHLS
jgi:hypothetical protein